MVTSTKKKVAQKSAPTKTRRTAKTAESTSALTNSDEVFLQAAELFRVMSAPMRLKIISSLCNSEKNVGQLLEEIKTTQPNMSQHLNTLFKSKVLGRRRDGVQIYYYIANPQVVAVCRSVCSHIHEDDVTI
jgi:ArsR family transcriptional regulator